MESPGLASGCEPPARRATGHMGVRRSIRPQMTCTREQDVVLAPPKRAAWDALPQNSGPGTVRFSFFARGGPSAPRCCSTTPAADRHIYVCTSRTLRLGPRIARLLGDP